MTTRRALVGLLVAAGIALPALGALGVRPADAGINRVGADYAGGATVEGINRVGAD